MLNIKIIEMLSKGASVTEITNAINPQQKGISFEDLKTYKELFVQNTSPQINLPVADNGGEWLSLVNNALPIVGELMKNRKTEGAKDDEYRQPEKRDNDNGRIIQPEITNDSKQPDSSCEKSRIIIPTAE